MILKYVLWLNTEKALQAYELLIKKASFRENAIMNSFKRYVFNEKVITEQGKLPFGIEVECLNAVIAKRIKWPVIIKESYDKLGCVEGFDYELVAYKKVE